MQHTIVSAEYSAVIDDHGARLIRLSGPDIDFWVSDCAVSKLPSNFLFPFYGALSSIFHYHLGETKTSASHHGILGDYSFFVSHKTDDCLKLELRSNLQTRRLYPFDFLFAIAFQMVGSRLAIVVQVENHTHCSMPFASGLTFCVRLPFDPGLKTEHYDVDFLYNVHPHRVKLLDNGLPGPIEPYELLYDHKLRLDASVPRNETILLNGLPSSFSLLSHKGQRTLKFICPELPYRSFCVCNGLNADRDNLLLTLVPALPPAINQSSAITSLPGITLLASEETWQADYSISMA